MAVTQPQIEYNFWGRNCEEGQEFILGEDTSDMMSSACLTGKTPASIYVNDMLLCTMTPDQPNGRLKQVMPYDKATRVKIVGGSADVVGYSARCNLDAAYEAYENACEKGVCPPQCQDVHKTEKKAAGAAKSPKAGAAKSPKKSPKAAPKKAAQERKVTQAKKPAEAVELSMDDVLEASGMSKEDYVVDVGQIVIKGKEYFIDYRDYKVYSGSEDEPKWEGYYHPKTQDVRKTRPDHSLDQEAVASGVKESGLKRQREARAQWEATHAGGDSDDETIESDEEEVGTFAKKRRIESEAKERRERGNTLFK
eukprot:Rhum_TRINITY_DN23080_c0_g1::Rhum_TRINITY_DN23080_c0_g1_i1::g.177062::m.177062